MRSTKKAALVCMLVTFLGALSSLGVSAAGLDDALTVVDGSVLTEDSYAEDTVTVLTRGNYLSTGTSRIEDKGSCVVAVGGRTNCHRVCDKVVCDLYLERLSGDGNWYTFKYWTCSATDVYTYSPTKTTSVVSGYWYRARGVHSATLNGTTESVNTKTDGIWIE